MYQKSWLKLISTQNFNLSRQFMDDDKVIFLNAGSGRNLYRSCSQRFGSRVQQTIAHLHCLEAEKSCGRLSKRPPSLLCSFLKDHPCRKCFTGIQLPFSCTIHRENIRYLKYEYLLTYNQRGWLLIKQFLYVNSFSCLMDYVLQKENNWRSSLDPLFFSFLSWGETKSIWYVGQSLNYCTSPGW